MTFKQRFNWLAQKPERNYTLGEVYQHYIQGKDWSDVNDNRLGLCRLERAHTAIGITGAFIIATTPQVPLLYASLGPVGNIAVWKALGLGMGVMITNMMQGQIRQSPKP